MSFRIIAGEFRGRVLTAPKGDATRPTSGMLREAVFNICHHLIEGCDFLDICAGSGAMGLEALSRGARSATFVESNRNAILALKKNIEILGVQDRAVVLPIDAVRAIKQLRQSGKVFAVIYADPPYQAFDLYADIIREVDASGLLVAGGELLVEESVEAPDYGDRLQQLVLKNCRKYGKSQLCHYKVGEI